MASRTWAAILGRLRELVGIKAKTPSPIRRTHSAILAKALFGLGQTLLDSAEDAPEAKACWLCWWAAWLRDPWLSEGCSLEELNAAMVEAHYQMQRTSLEAADSRKKSFSAWLAGQVKLGFKGGHALTKPPSDGPHQLGP